MDLMLHPLTGAKCRGRYGDFLGSGGHGSKSPSNLSSRDCGSSHGPSGASTFGPHLVFQVCNKAGHIALHCYPRCDDSYHSLDCSSSVQAYCSGSS